LRALSGIDLRRALRLALDMGCHIRNRKGTGETVVTHPLWERPITVSTHRKDCPRILSTALARLMSFDDQNR
jgi:hypothetical protein